MKKKRKKKLKKLTKLELLKLKMGAIRDEMIEFITRRKINPHKSKKVYDRKKPIQD